MLLLFHSLLKRVEGTGGWRFRLKLDVQGQEDGKILNVDGQGDGDSRNLDSFHGRHMCIIPYFNYHA